MRVETFHYGEGGWSVNPLPDLDSERTLVLAFGASEIGDGAAPLAALGRAYPRSHLIGCSTAGEILGGKVSDGGLAVAVARFDHSTLASASAAVESVADSFGAGQQVATQLVRPGLRGVLLLGDGVGVNGSELVRGVSSILPGSVVVTGGLAGDGNRFKRTWVLCEGAARSGHVSAVGFYTKHVCIGHGSQGGWDNFGPVRVVTRSQGNVLYELDGRPALPLYKEYLGGRAAGLPASALLFPLALRAAPGGGSSLVRSVLAVDEASQSMTFAGDIPQGSLAQLMTASFDRLIQGASDAASMTAGKTGGADDVLSIAISCVGRRLLLGQRTGEEAEAVLAALPPSTRQIGFYSYGEIAPLAAGSCDLHNQTMTVTTISEV